MEYVMTVIDFISGNTRSLHGDFEILLYFLFVPFSLWFFSSFAEIFNSFSTWKDYKLGDLFQE